MSLREGYIYIDLLREKKALVTEMVPTEPFLSVDTNYHCYRHTYVSL